jgi:hypothetical protein
MRIPAQKIVLSFLRLMLCIGVFSAANAQDNNEPEKELLELDQSCIINVLNRTVSVQEDGTWFLTNVPSNMGQIRARATCIRDGDTERGASEYFSIEENNFSETPRIYKAVKERIPTRLEYASPGTNIYSFNEDGTITFIQDNDTILLSAIGEAYQALVNAHYADGEVENVTQSSSGINYNSTNPNIARVTSNGLVEAVSPGNASIISRKDEVISLLQVSVDGGDDTDGDGIPDEYETANGLNPNDPIDALEDIDNDGLTALEEFNAGTSIYLADSDADGINDREELIEGSDGVITNPVLRDSDGDLLPDFVEVSIGTDPNDADDTNYEAAIVSMRSIPSTVAMTFNSIDSEVSTQLLISATLVDGSRLDVTSSSFGTSYASQDLSVASFGIEDGEVFGGGVGETTVVVSLFDFEVEIPITVESFQPVGIASLNFTGNGIDSDVQGDFVYIAASSGGVHIVDVSEKENPQITASLSSASGAVDVKIDGDTLYVARASQGIDIYNVSDKANPVLIINYQTAGSAQELGFERGHLFIAIGNGGIEIVDVSEPSTPIFRSQLDGLGNIISVDAEDDKAVVANSSSVIVLDISDLASPLRLGSINIGNLRAAVMEGDYAYVACYTCGYKIINIGDPMSLKLVGGDSRFYPSDVALTSGLAFFSDILFTNAVPFVNIVDPQNSLFQGVIDIRQFGDRDAFGLSVDSGFVYSVGSGKLYISQYRMLNDTQGVAPTVSIVSPVDGAVVVEGSKIQILIDATDDIAVSTVQLTVNDELIRSDTTLPYAIPYTVPDGVTALELQVNAVDFGNNVGTNNVLLSVEPDADDDGLGDNEELNTWLTNPNDPDSDGDGLVDGDEVRRATNPVEKDSDSDGIEDGQEVLDGTDPLNPDTNPPSIITVVPLLGAIDICENAPITVSFSEEIKRNTINAQNASVYLTVTEQVVMASYSLQSSDTEIFINPAGILADNSEYTVEIKNIRDAAGNVLSDTFMSSFITGNCVDDERPFVVVSSPTNGSIDIGVNAKITLLLNEPIQPETVIDENFYVYDQNTNIRIPGIIEVTDDNAGLVFTPNTPFLVGRRHYVVLGRTILDQFSNHMTNFSMSFITSFAPDGQGPQVVSTTVEEGQTQIPVNAKFAVLFDEQINALYLKDVDLLDNNGESVGVTRSLSVDRRRIIVEPSNVLDSDTTYTYKIGGIQDLSGNLLASNLNIQFTTSDLSDTQPGSAISWSIPSGLRDTPLNPLIDVEFSEAIDPTTINDSTFYLYDTNSRRKVEGTIELLDANKRLKFIPNDVLRDNTPFYFYVGYSPFLKDLAGNNVSQNGFRVFYTGINTDELSPQVVNTSILDGLVNIPVNSSVVVTFDSSISDSVSCSSNEVVSITSGDLTIDTTAVLSTDKRSLTVSTVGLARSTSYQVTIRGACDYAGNFIAQQSFSFTTSDTDTADLTAPTISASVPINRALDVSVTDDIVVTFSEDISFNSLPPITGGGVTVTGDYSISGNILTFSPDESLAGNTSYTIGFRNTIFDFANNNRWLSTYTFTTQNVEDNQTPSISVISPINGASDINPLQDVVLSFDEPINPDTLNANNVVLFSNGEKLSSTIFRSADGKDVTLSATMPAESIVSVAMTANVTDLSGNRVIPFISSFITGPSNADYARPSIVKQTPTNGSSAWTDLNQVYFYTNEALDASTLEDAFNIAQDGALIGAQIELLGDGRTIRVTADDNFADNALIQMYWDGGALDLFGNPLNNSQTFFTTGDSSDSEGVRARVTAYSPNSSNRNVPLNPVLRVAFSEPLDENSLIVDDNVILYNITNDSAKVPISVSLNTAGNILLITPSDQLTADNTYYLYMSATILDTDGDNLANNAATYFYTSESADIDNRAPTILAFSPAQGSNNVGTLPQFSFALDEAINRLTFNRAGSINVQYSANDSVIRYEYIEPLEPGASHVEMSPMVEDFATNALANIGNTFTTAMGPDLVKPSYAETNIETNDTEVPVNFSFETTFNEPIQNIGLSSENIYFIDVIEGTNVDASFALSSDGTKLTITPTTAFLSGRRYYAYITGLRDLSGNTLHSVIKYFVTSFDDDTLPPQIASTTVVEGQVDVPINARLNVRFNESLSLLNYDSIKLIDDAGNDVELRVLLSRSRQLITLVPNKLLAPLSLYRLVVQDQQDTSKNAQVSDIDISFTTGDSVDLLTGSVVLFNFDSNSQNVSRNVLLSAQFNEPIDAALLDSDSNYVSDSSTGLKVPLDVVLSDDRLTLSMRATDILKANRTYYWYLGYSPYLTDFAGNFMSQNSFRTFKTGTGIDEDAPTVSSININDGNTELPVNGRVMFNFDERLGSFCLDGAVSASDGNNQFDVNVAYANAQSSVVITPSNNWSSNTTYTVSIDGLCDYSGNTIQAQQVSFTTLDDNAVDATAPTLQSITPSNNSTDVSVDLESIVITFSESIDKGSRLVISTPDAIVQGSYEIVGNQLTFTPTIALRGGVRHTLALVSGIFDLAGNSRYLGYAYFTTENNNDSQAPTIVAVSPQDSASDIEPSQEIVLTFDEPINSASLNNQNIALYANGMVIRPTVFRSSDGTKVTLNAGMPANSLVSLVVTENVEDVAGNSLSPFISSFTTGDSDNETTRPRVSLTIPANGSAGWLGLDSFVVFFTETMDLQSIEDSIKVTEDGVRIEISVSLSGDGRTLTVSKQDAFSSAARVTYFFDTAVRDLAGNPLFHYSGSFIMEDVISERIGENARLLAYHPVSSSANVPLNPVISASFNEAIDETTLTADTVILYDTRGSWTSLPATISLANQGKLIEVKPDELLEADVRYYISYNNSILDTDGDPLRNNYATYFTTSADGVEDDSAPLLSSRSPSDGQKDVGINARLSAVFDESMNPLSFINNDSERANIQFSEDNKHVTYSNTLPYLPETDVTDTIGNIADIAGNLASANISATFTTGSGPDLSPPVILDTTFANGAQMVATNTVLKWFYSEPLNPASITSGGVYLYDTVTRENVPISYELSPDGKQLTVVPSEPLQTQNLYYAYAYYCKDLSGNAAPNSFTSFTTGTEEDLVLPTITSSSVSNNQAGVPVNARLNIRFSEPSNVFADAISLTDSDSTPVPFTVTISRGRTLITLSPKALFNANSDYGLVISNITDIADNQLASNFRVNFVTGNDADFATSPIVSWSIPVNNTLNVPLNPLLQVSYNEIVSRPTIDEDSIYLLNSSNNARVAGSRTLSSDGKTLTFIPSALLDSEVLYYLYVGYSTYLYDLSGNIVGQNGFRSFRTGSEEDDTPVSVNTLSIPNGSTDLPTNAQVVIEFSERLSDACSVASSINITQAGNIIDSVVSLATNKTTLTIQPSINLQTSTSYQVYIDDLCDYAGNKLSDVELMSFTISAIADVDILAPTLATIVPENRAVGIALDANIVVTLSEPIAATNKITLKLNNVVVPTTQTTEGNIITLIPAEALQATSQYKVELLYLYDYVGNRRYFGATTFTTE